MKQKQLQQTSVLRFKRFVGKSFSAFNSMHKVINIGALAGITLACTYTSTAQTKNKVSTPVHQTEEEEHDLESVMVTASKLTTPINQTAKLVTVISAKELSQAPVRSLQDLLVYAAGVDVVQRGGHGVQADITIRGGSHDQTIVLLNGINLTNAETGHLSFDIPINLSDIERIEIIHGPAALSYGIGAFSGGINIITRKDAKERVFAELTAGKHALLGLEARVAGQFGKFTTSISASNKRSKGYRPNTDYNITNTLWQGHLELDPLNKLDIQLGYNKKDYGANAFYTAKYPMQYEYTSRYISSIRGEFGINNLRFVPILYWDRAYDQFDLTKGMKENRNNHRTDNYGASLATSYISSLGTTTLLGDYRREAVISSNLGTVLSNPKDDIYKKGTHRTNVSVSLEHTISWSQFVLSAGLMMNHNTLRKNHYDYTPSVSATWRPNKEWSLSGLWSKAISLPSFVNLYYNTRTHTSDGKLVAEEAQSFELGTKYKHRAFSAYLTGFINQGKNLIDWVKYTSTDAKWQAKNHASNTTYGVETGIALQLASYLPALGSQSQIRLDYLHMDQTNNNESNLISLYAFSGLRDKLTAKFSHQIVGGLEANWNFRYQKRNGQFINLAGSKQSYPAFATLDLKLDYAFSPQLNLSANLNNLTDTQYSDFGTIPQAGFWWSVGLAYRLR